MTGEGDRLPVRDGIVAVIDEASPPVGAGVYYLVAAVVVFDPELTRERVREVVGSRRRPFHYRTEGPTVIARMVEVLEESGAMASVLWRSASRRGQVDTRRDLLALHVRRLADEGITHLLIESGNAVSDGRDRATVLRVFEHVGGVPFEYDWYPKREPLLWLADALCGIAAEHLCGRRAVGFKRLWSKGVIDVENS